MLLEIRAARFHLDEDALGPEAVGEFFATLGLDRILALDQFELRGTGLFRDAKLQRGTGLLHATMAEGAEEVIEEKLCLALFVALQRAGERFKLCEGGLQFSRGHGRSLQDPPKQRKAALPECAVSFNPTELARRVERLESSASEIALEALAAMG